MREGQLTKNCPQIDAAGRFNCQKKNISEREFSTAPICVNRVVNYLKFDVDSIQAVVFTVICFISLMFGSQIIDVKLSKGCKFHPLRKITKLC